MKSHDKRVWIYYLAVSFLVSTDSGEQLPPDREGLSEGQYFYKTLSVKTRLFFLQGPYIYELFSIMIHSGSAAGGHYYAYIK